MRVTSEATYMTRINWTWNRRWHWDASPPSQESVRTKDANILGRRHHYIFFRFCQLKNVFVWFFDIAFAWKILSPTLWTHLVFSRDPNVAKAFENACSVDFRNLLPPSPFAKFCSVFYRSPKLETNHTVQGFHFLSLSLCKWRAMKTMGPLHYVHPKFHD